MKTELLCFASFLIFSLLVRGSAFDGTAAIWPGGNVYYSFDTTDGSAVPPNLQRAFLDAAGEWATFADLHFIPRTTQSNYVTVQVNAGLEGGQSDVGMIGGQQFLSIGPDAWNRGTICHEIGHTLGLVHEHQRSDRDSYVTILSNNIVSGGYADFVLLTNSRNQGPYDFLSVMHYSRSYLSVDPGVLDTIEAVPAYSQFLNLMGEPGPIVLSAGDRAGMAAVYGAGPGPSPVVTNTQDSGPGSLRAALYFAFDNPGTFVTFNIPTNDPGSSNGVFTIQPTDQLPWLVNDTILDGGSQSATTNGPSIQINGALAPVPGTYASGLMLAGSGCFVQSLVINGFAASSIMISNGTGNFVSGCYLSIDPTGNIPVSNGLPAVTISAGATDNTIGGAGPGQRNIISGSALQGLVIRDPGTSNNVVAGNYIGLNAAGTAALSNTWAGVEIFNGAQHNTIGGGNVISGNGQQGVMITDPQTTGNMVEGNYIGLNPAGNAALPNQIAGVGIYGPAQSNIIGPRNIISGNGNQGVAIGYAGATGNVVAGNHIGLDASGEQAVPNTWSGVNIYGGAQGNRIDDNVISGNDIQGISFQDSGTASNLAQGNWIGLDATGTAAIPNAASGVEMFNGAQDNFIGGVGQRNFISGNAGNGVLLDDSATGNFVQGNTISSNGDAGLMLFGGATSNLVGGTRLGAANLIVGNRYGGIELYDAATSNNVVRGNSIFDNNDAGIEVYTSANQSAVESAPTLTSAVVTTNTTLTGALTSVADTTFHLDFYAGGTYLGAQDILTTAAGSVNFSVSLNSPVPIGRVIAATATDPAGNTSSLSAGVAVTGTDSVGDGITDAWRGAHFGGTGATTNSLSCATCDPDHDGMDNEQEFLAGTDPNNAGSKLILSGVSPYGTVSFPSAQGITYRLEFKDDLTAPGWSLFADQILGTGGEIQLTDPTLPGLTQRYYLLEVLP